MTLLLFTLGRDRYGIPVEDVRRILLAVAVTRLPGAPRVVEGVVDVQGSLTPVFDLRRRFGLAPRELVPEDQFVLAAAAGRRVLLHVDRVEDVVDVDETRIEDSAAIVTGDVPLAGVAKLEDGLVLIHDLDTFLTQAETEALESALAAAGGDSGAPA